MLRHLESNCLLCGKKRVVNQRTTKKFFIECLASSMSLFDKSTEKDFLTNLDGQKLACTTWVKHPESKNWILLCHGVFSGRKNRLFETFAAHCPLNCISIDFYTCGDSDGAKEEWSLGGYDREVDIDIRGVVLHMREAGLTVLALVGHSRGANDILMYGSKYDDVPYLVSLASRFDAKGGVDPWFHPGDRQKLERGEVEVVPCAKIAPDGTPRSIKLYDLKQRIQYDMTQVIRIKNAKKIWYVHGTADDVIPVTDAGELQKKTEVPSEIVLIPEAGHNMRSPLGKKGLEPFVAEMKAKVFPELARALG
eukprot:Blabericola_migrator_1__8684@NODE_456_length_8320_cov_227_265964_g357_i0_p3_GENE_NODE_456_length_8320_cov_227_265964_g357_i0NODE_456_length_8320_cov_227_265964_g357_i0_p3_ORF_typecomplete_len308_score47_30Hydrolase_4/PF12146_8/7_9e15Abhydrolase_1/PF00561_20/9_8e10BAAT_C/PF08840_11/9_9e08Abhydrolase_6/PF12697_7/1_4e07DUF1749/PF08538_10/8_9e06DUF1749/PF08538_10/1_1e02DLH/PF01738_18/2e05Peptidase_S9/PF00326_21/2_4e05Abhydrolase_5/PF12695_7/4_3e03Abhydrolase_5/PF12695_7/0_65Abhydrolase_5/PF12695_7/0